MKAQLETLTATSVLRFHLERQGLDQLQEIALQERPVSRTPATFHRVSSFVEVPGEEVMERTVSLLASLAGQGDAVVFWIHGDGHRYRLLYGVLEENGKLDPGEGLRGALQAYYPGSELRPIDDLDAEAMLNALNNRHYVAALTGIPSERQLTPVESRLDEALDGLSQVPFDLVLVARPLPGGQVTRWRQTLLELGSMVETLANTQVTETSSQAYSASLQEAFQRTLSEGTSLSESHTESHEVRHAERMAEDINARERNQEAMKGAALGAAIGALAGGAIGALGGPPGVVAGAKAGAMLGGFAGNRLAATDKVTKTKEDGSADSTSHQVIAGRTWNDVRGWSESETRQHQEQVSKQISMTQVDKEAHALAKIVDLHLERVATGSGVGLWDVSIHTATERPQDLEVVCNVLQGALRGDLTHLEPMRWVPIGPGRTAAAWVAALDQPVLALPASPLDPGLEQLPTRLTSYELAHWIRPPIRDLPGFVVRPSLHFGRIPTRGHRSAIELGHLMHLSRHLCTERVQLPVDDLASHLLLVGTTGSGKSTTTKRLLWQLQSRSQPVPFMLVEPAKSEYGKLFAALEAAGKRPLRLVVGLRGEGGLHLNPLQATPGLPLGRHVDAVRGLLRSCFAMQESLPQVLEQLVVQVYRDAGLSDFGATYDETSPPCPTMATLAEASKQANAALKALGYDHKVSNNLAAAIRVRLESLCSGTKGIVFDGQEPDWPILLSRPVFVELRDIAETDVRRLVLASILQRIYAHREAADRRGEPRKGLRHLLLFEEAHHLLRRVEGSGPSADLIREVNIQVSDAFAELRAYGQGICVIDQSPSSLDPAVLRNTNSKLAHRLLFSDDCRSVGDSMGLDEEHQQELRRLERGECLYHGPGLIRPLHVCIEQVPQLGD